MAKGSLNLIEGVSFSRSRPLSMGSLFPSVMLPEPYGPLANTGSLRRAGALRYPIKSLMFGTPRIGSC